MWMRNIIKLIKISQFYSNPNQTRSMCSPSQGPCCTAECSLKYGDKCRDDNGCRDPSYCDGRMPHCPPSVNKPNKTICNKEFVCFMGVSCCCGSAACIDCSNDGALNVGMYWIHLPRLWLGVMSMHSRTQRSENQVVRVVLQNPRRRQSMQEFI